MNKSIEEYSDNSEDDEDFVEDQNKANANAEICVILNLYTKFPRTH